MIKSKGNFAFAALLFSAISGISEGFLSGTFAGTVEQLSLGTNMFQDVMCLGQDVMCTDERMCIRSRNSVCSACSGTVCASADALLLQGTRPRCTGPLYEP